MRHIKRLGLAAVMALALSGIAGAGSASAAQFAVQGPYPEVVGSFSAEGVTLTAPGGIVFGCESTGFATTISKPSSKLTAEPLFNNCTWKVGGATHKQTFSMNGCSFELKPGAETEAGSFDGSVDVGPPGCGPITLNDEFCQRSYPAQSIDAEYVIQGKTVEASVDGVMSGTYKGSPANCASSTSLNVRVDWTLETVNGYGLTLLWHNGVFTAGGQIGAETYPAFLDGGQDAADKHVLTLTGGRQLKCQDVALSGQLSGASSSFSLSPIYANCVVEVGGTKLPATVDTTGCSYQIAVAGTFGVSCAGSPILLRTFQNDTEFAKGVSLCTYEIGSQSGLSGVGLSNFGEGDERGVELDFGVTNLAWTKAQGTVGNCGGKSGTSSYNGTTALTGSVG